jgi:hypothetical protein
MIRFFPSHRVTYSPIHRITGSPNHPPFAAVLRGAADGLLNDFYEMAVGSKTPVMGQQR